MSDVKADPSCQDDYDPNSMPVDGALAFIDRDIQPITGFERVAIRSALDRILAEDVRSPINVPAFANSAMDGYALNSADLPDQGAVELTVAGKAFAGQPYDGAVARGQCVRIMTGAVIPAGLDTVVMQEHVEVNGDRIRVGTGHSAGQNVRHAGEDLQQGQAVLHQGHPVHAADLGLLASLGIAEVSVTRRLRVAFFSTGDELRSIGEPLEEGQIYDSNRYSLFGMLTRLGVDIIDMGVIKDERQSVRAAFQAAAASADAVITTGGVSVGEADYVKETLEELGQVSFWKIAMKPGRPLAFGRLQRAWFFGLPGNPVSAMVTFYQFVQPALQRLRGEAATRPLTLRLPCVSALRKQPGRVEFQRGIIHQDDQGRTVVRSTGPQGSHVLSSMSRANCFIILPLETGNVESGTEVEVQPFDALI